jgi:serine/threonine-protein kinase HipA
VFNILMDNTDDHEKNHVLLMDDAQHLLLAPAFDVLPAAQGLGYQQLRVGRDGADSTIENAYSEASLFGLSADEARTEAVRVAKACEQWKAHFAHAGVSTGDIEYLSQFIDRDFLLTQRNGLTSKAARRATGRKSTG